MIKRDLNCESDIKPEKYAIENIVDGKCDIVLNNTIEEKEKQDENGNIQKYYTYATYRIEKNNYRDTLEDEISTDAGFEMWLNFAKEQYQNQVEEVTIEERLTALEDGLLDMAQEVADNG